MATLLVLFLLQLLSGPAFSLTAPSQDYWGEYGPYGACSRTCGTGVAVRTRKCSTARTDGGHNCVGSSKSYRTCNLQECPAGSKDFREEQCSKFDRSNFQSKSYNWLPYYGAANPCELNCVPRGQNFFYRHRPTVVDGTPCYVGRRDICIEGVCRALSHGEILGMDQDTSSPQVLAPAPRLRESLTYAYTYGVYSECSAPCNGGMQMRSVQCVVQDSTAPHAVDNSYCINQGLQRPASQQACNMHPCAEYTVSSFSVCSVTCGDGQQTREVFCVGPAGERIGDHACQGLTRPPTVQACRKPACQTHISWHVTEFGLCSRSCGGGVRERRVACMDTDLNPYGDERCGPQARPPSVDTCNTQACPGAQVIPSVQDPRGQQTTMRGFMPYVPGEPSVHRPHDNTVYDPYTTSVVGPHCYQSYYGCCPDGHTSATGPRGEGCQLDNCLQSRFGCCLDGVTPAQGFGRAGCPEYHTPSDPSPPVQSGEVCSMPRDEGPCDTWKSRFYYHSGTRKCTQFWYGGCQGNHNNFASMSECQRRCDARAPASPTRSGRAPTTRRGRRVRAN
ncbi:papilin b, proteoglycan-like sulfated glycoprotein [Osmerus mordax]|uniref:papilin b, proteoglycan-like sulfated glycoprotein n=1 Tax=Osmerus mordax TaxID=8014 RepID=UPI00350EFF8A